MPNHDLVQLAATGGRFALFLPSDASARPYPIVTWGNGTGATPATYDQSLRQLASWGYAVIDSDNTQTGARTDILTGAKYLVRRDKDEHDPLHNRLDTGRIAALGHSQGATGVLNANRLGRGMITTTVPIGLPTDASGAGLIPFSPNLTDLSGPVFYLAGGLDLVLSPPSGIVAAYHHTPGPAVVATRQGAEHLLLPADTIGYLTAWLR